jgi:hypothetical protein
MTQLHVVSALSNKRAELAGILRQLEQQLVQQRTNLAHLDATMRLFDPDIQPKQIRAKQSRVRSVWFRPGECLRLIYDELRDAAQPIATRELAERIMRVKAMGSPDEFVQNRTLRGEAYFEDGRCRDPWAKRSAKANSPTSTRSSGNIFVSIAR